LVATIRALRHHGGAQKEEYGDASLERVKAGFPNLEKHIENAIQFGIKPVVAINHRIGDAQDEIDFIIEACEKLGVKAVVSKGWAEGGNGTQELAAAVVANVESGSNDFKALYDWNDSVENKIETICKKVYGADGVDFQGKALVDLRRIYRIGLDKLPICMAKTQKSFSDDETKRARPNNFRITVREIEIAAGAGFLIPITGAMMRMPGLPTVPASENMSIDENGKISGLS